MRGEFLDNVKPLETRQRLVDGCRSEACLLCASQPEVAIGCSINVLCTCSVQQNAVDFPKESQRQRQPSFEEPSTMIECRDIIADFMHIIQRDAGFLIQFIQQQV